MDIERFRTYQPQDDYAEQRLLDYLMELERRGWRLTTLELVGQWFDDSCGEDRWEKVRVKDWRTGETLGTYLPQEFRELDYREERWHDAEHYYE